MVGAYILLCIDTHVTLPRSKSTTSTLHFSIFSLRPRLLHHAFTFRVLTAAPMPSGLPRRAMIMSHDPQRRRETIGPTEPFVPLLLRRQESRSYLPLTQQHHACFSHSVIIFLHLHSPSLHTLTPRINFPSPRPAFLSFSSRLLGRGLACLELALLPASDAGEASRCRRSGRLNSALPAELSVSLRFLNFLGGDVAGCWAFGRTVRDGEGSSLLLLRRSFTSVFSDSGVAAARVGLGGVTGRSSSSMLIFLSASWRRGEPVRCFE